MDRPTYSHHRDGSEGTNAFKRSPRIYVVTYCHRHLLPKLRFLVPLFHCLSSRLIFCFSSDEFQTMKPSARFQRVTVTSYMLTVILLPCMASWDNLKNRLGTWLVGSKHIKMFDVVFQRRAEQRILFILLCSSPE